MDIKQRKKIREILTNRFSEGELKTLAFDLGIDYENLPGGSKADTARELVRYCERKGLVRELVTAITEVHPKVAGDIPVHVIPNQSVRPGQKRGRLPYVIVILTLSVTAIVIGFIFMAFQFSSSARSLQTPPPTATVAVATTQPTPAAVLPPADVTPTPEIPTLTSTVQPTPTGTATPTPTPAPAATEVDAPVKDLSGEWTGTLTQPGGFNATRYDALMTLEQDGTSVTGTFLITATNDASIYFLYSLEGEVEDDTFRFQEISVIENTEFAGRCVRNATLDIAVDSGKETMTGDWYGFYCSPPFQDGVKGQITLERAAQ
jgi:hypothetical protein